MNTSKAVSQEGSVIAAIVQDIDSHQEAIDRVQWVRGCTLGHTTSGCGYVDGKLCAVTIMKEDGGYKLNAEPVTLKEAAQVMMDTHNADMRFDGMQETDDEGWTLFLQQLAAA